MLVTKRLTVTIDFHCIFFYTMEVNGYRQLFGQQKKETQVWNNFRVSKWWPNSHFWVNYPFESYFVTSYQRMFSERSGKVLSNLWT